MLSITEGVRTQGESSGDGDNKKKEKKEEDTEVKLDTVHAYIKRKDRHMRYGLSYIIAHVKLKELR